MKNNNYPNFPIRRSASRGTTLTMLNRRSTKYKYYIGIITVFLIITSTIVIFTAISLLEWYMMPHLKFWDEMFEVAPYLMLGVGIYTFIVSFFGFFISTSGHRGLLIVFAVLLSVACITQMVSVYTLIKVQFEIKGNKNDALTKGISQLKYYGDKKYENITASWDKMQQDLHCCGVNSYRDWQFDKNRESNLGERDVPNSCCVSDERHDTCGKGKINKEEAFVLVNRIYMYGCIKILKDWMENQILIDVYTGVGVVTAIIEIIAIALVSAFAAQINRKRVREERIHLDRRFPNSPGFSSNGDILLDTEYDPKPEYESSRNESEI